MNPAEEGIKRIYESMIKGLLDYLKTGTFPNNSPNSYMTAYSEVHRLADDDHDSSDKLFEYFKKVISDHVVERNKLLASETDEQLIDDFLKENEKCNILMYWMKRIFTYLDKFYTKNKNVGTLCTNAMRIYQEKMFIPVKEKLYTAVNKLIKEDRDCNVIYRYKIKTMLRIFEEVDYKNPEIAKDNDKLFWSGECSNEFIKEWYNKYFSKQSDVYASIKAKNAIQSMSAPEYIKTSLKYLDEEEQRKSEYINKIFWSNLDEINSKHFVEANAKILADMETGFRYMLKNKKDDEIKEAYDLISRNEACKKTITEKFDPYIRERGDELNKNKDLMKDPIKLIPELIKLKKEMDGLVAMAFNNDILFQDTKNKAFSFFMNKEIYSKQLSNYTDYMMKKGIKAFNEAQIEDNLNDIINLFKCLNNKLVFQLEANKKLSDRLIQNKTLSIVAEKSFISKLKTEAGVTYVNKMTEMMKDLEKSKGEIDLYRNQRHRGKPNGIQFNVQVVSQSAWEVNKNKQEKIEIPPCLSVCMSDFNQFYITRNKNHKLLWCYGLGTLDLQYLYLPKKYLSVSTLCQYCLLLNLEKYGKLSFQKLSELLGYNVDLLLNDASGLIFNPSYKRTRNPANGVIVGNFKDELKPETEVEINKNFVSNNLKFQTLPMVQRKKADSQVQEQEEAVQQKKYQDILLQMALTRIMKSRIGLKTTHVWLVGETAKQMDLFRAQPQQIKEAIEKLIEKQIMKRSEKDRTCYEYVA